MKTALATITCVYFLLGFSGAFAQETSGEAEKSKFAAWIVGTKWKYTNKEKSFIFLTSELMSFNDENNNQRSQAYKVKELGLIPVVTVGKPPGLK